jgi:hypothetical protein
MIEMIDDDSGQEKEYVSDVHEGFVLSWQRAVESLQQEKERILQIPEIGKFLSEFAEFEDENGEFHIDLNMEFRNANRAEMVFLKSSEG